MVPYMPHDPTRLGFYIRMVDFASHLNATYPGGLNAAVIMMAIAIADFEGKPVDRSSLAAMLCLPRSTLRRHVLKLEKEGFVTCRRERKFTMVRGTEKVKAVTIPVFEEHLDRLLPWACNEANGRGIGCAQNGRLRLTPDGAGENRDWLTPKRTRTRFTQVGDNEIAPWTGRGDG